MDHNFQKYFQDNIINVEKLNHKGNNQLFEVTTINRKYLLKKIYFPKFWSAFQYFFIDDGEYLYIMTYEKGKIPKEYIYDIFNPDGFFIGRKSLEGSKIKTKNNRLYCLREKDSGYKELVVYKMRWE